MEISERQQAKDGLTAYRRIVTFQHGEDGIIEKMFETIPKGDKWCVEIGDAWPKFAMTSSRLFTTRPE